jgi:hypothetical protein
MEITEYSSRTSEARKCADVRRKPVYLDGVAIGSACTWYDVAAILTGALGRMVAVRSAQDQTSEGPDGFYATAPRSMTLPGSARMSISGDPSPNVRTAL